MPTVTKVTEITPSLQAAAEVRTGGLVLSAGEGWDMSQQAFSAPQGWASAPGNRWPAAR